MHYSSVFRSILDSPTLMMDCGVENWKKASLDGILIVSDLNKLLSTLGIQKVYINNYMLIIKNFLTHIRKNIPLCILQIELMFVVSKVILIRFWLFYIYQKETELHPRYKGSAVYSVTCHY